MKIFEVLFIIFVRVIDYFELYVWAVLIEEEELMVREDGLFVGGWVVVCRFILGDWTVVGVVFRVRELGGLEGRCEREEESLVYCVGLD